MTTELGCPPPLYESDLLLIRSLLRWSLTVEGKIAGCSNEEREFTMNRVEVFLQDQRLGPWSVDKSLEHNVESSQQNEEGGRAT